jgi:hypothetical protein
MMLLGRPFYGCVWVSNPPWPRRIVGGSYPEGYVYIGNNHGLTIWGSMDTVALSMMDAEAAGNASGK